MSEDLLKHIFCLSSPGDKCSRPHTPRSLPRLLLLLLLLLLLFLLLYPRIAMVLPALFVQNLERLKEELPHCAPTSNAIYADDDLFSKSIDREGNFPFHSFYFRYNRAWSPSINSNGNLISACQGAILFSNVPSSPARTS
eukprot:767888-Hanusia_phi.AAC.6